MARSERDIFSDHVAALLRQLGVYLDDVTARHRDRLLIEARKHRLNDHEAALAVAHRHARDLLEDDVERARVLMDRLTLIAAEWDDQELVSRAVVAPLEREARAALRRSEGT